jgi:Nitrate and nitrite sensing
MATDLGKLLTRLQLERGDVAYFIYLNDTTMKENLTQRYATTDEAINNMTTWIEIIVPASPNGNEEEGEVMLNKTSFQMRLSDFRTQIQSEDNNNTVFEVYKINTPQKLPMIDE